MYADQKNCKQLYALISCLKLLCREFHSFIGIPARLPSVHQFIHPFIHPLGNLYSNIFIYSFIHLSIYAFIRSHIHLFISSFIHRFLSNHLEGSEINHLKAIKLFRSNELALLSRSIPPTHVFHYSIIHSFHPTYPPSSIHHEACESSHYTFSIQVTTGNVVNSVKMDINIRGHSTSIHFVIHPFCHPSILSSIIFAPNLPFTIFPPIPLPTSSSSSYLHSKNSFILPSIDLSVNFICLHPVSAFTEWKIINNEPKSTTRKHRHKSKESINMDGWSELYETEFVLY